MAKITKEGVIEFLETMSVLEINEFVQELQDKWGVTAAAPVAAVAGAPAGVAVEEETEQTEFDGPSRQGSQFETGDTRPWCLHRGVRVSLESVARVDGLRITPRRSPNAPPIHRLSAALG